VIPCLKTTLNGFSPPGFRTTSAVAKAILQPCGIHSRAVRNLGPVFRVIYAERYADNETNNDDPDDYVHGGHSLLRGRAGLWFCATHTGAVECEIRLIRGGWAAAYGQCCLSCTKHI
jgi:hypothetical protein